MKWDTITCKAIASFCRHVVASIVLSLLASLLLGCNPANDASASGSRNVPANDIREGAGSEQPAGDENLADRLRTALRSDASLAGEAEGIRILVVERRIIVTGNVGSSAIRQSVEQNLRTVAGDAQIENRLRVVPLAPGTTNRTRSLSPEPE